MSHAVLAPSSAHRWLVCTPSARLEQQFPDTNSEVAAEGTFAHKWAEVNLLHFNKQLADALFLSEIDAMKKNQFYSKGLEDYVALYVDTVIDKFHSAQNTDKGASLLLEQRFNLSAYVPDCFGHADAVILSEGKLEVVDLKYGAGVAVTAKDNPQLKLYALGAYYDLSFLYDIKHITVTIVQPRNGGISSDSFSAADLLAWAESIKPIARLAFNGGGNFVAGDHCKFCKAANQCKALADFYAKHVKDDFDNPNLLSDDEIADILLRADDIIKWLNNIKDFALSEAVNKGKRWKGFKLVEGRSVRQITDPDAAAMRLYETSGDDIPFWKPRELLGLTALEKNFGKKTLNEILEGLIYKPKGKPTLVQDSDPRPEWNNPKIDFDTIEEKL